MKVFVFREGKRYGPYSVEKLREFLQQGNFTVEDLVCLDGETWQKISEAPGLTLEERPVAIESSVEEQPQVEPTPHLEAKPDEVLPEEEVQTVQEEAYDSAEGSKSKRKILVWSGIGSFVTALAVGLFFFFSDNGGSSGEGNDEDYFTKPIEESNRFQKGATIVAALLGEVSVTDPSSVDGNSSGKRSAREGEVLLPGSLIETGSESEVVLLFSNGHLTTLGSDSKMSVDAFVQEEFDGSEEKVGELKREVSPSRMKLDLDFGEMIVDVKKLNKESSLVITTNVGIVGIRGTRFGVSSEKGSVAVSVLEGLVEFLDEKKVVHALEQEKRLEAEKGEEPELVALANEEKERMEATILEAIRKTKDLTLADLAKSELRTTFITIDNTPQGQKFYSGQLENELMEIDLNEIEQAVRKREGWQVVLRVHPRVTHSLALDVMRQIGNGGKPGFIYRPWLDPENKSGQQDRESLADVNGSYLIELPGRPPSLELNPMPRLQLRIGDYGKVYINGSEIEDGTDSSMPDLIRTLKAQKGMRDQLISSGARTKQEAELKIQIESSGIANASASINVLNACAQAGVQKVTFFPGQL
jgi:biopolymer transport protein ExbD